MPACPEYDCHSSEKYRDMPITRYKSGPIFCSDDKLPLLRYKVLPDIPQLQEPPLCKASQVQAWGLVQDRFTWAGYPVLLYGFKESCHPVRD